MKRLIRFFRNQEKRTLLFIGGGALLLVLIVLLIVFKPFSSGKNHKACEVIPNNAFVVFRFNNPGEIVHDGEYETIGKNLSNLPAVSSFILGLQQADTVFSVTENFKDFLSEATLYVSLHPEGKDNVATLFVLELPENRSVEQIHEELTASGKGSLTEKEIGGKQCYSIGKKQFNLYSNGNLIIGATSQKILELSIASSDKKSGLSENDEFMQAASTSSRDCPVNVMVNTPLLYRSLGQLVSGDTYSNMAFLQTFTTWGNVDIKFQHNTLVFSGLFPLPTDGSSFMSLFSESPKEATPQILSMLPVNTSAAFSFGFGDFEKFFSGYCSRLLKANQNVYDNKEEVAHLNEQAETSSLESCIYDHINGLLCVFSVAANPGQEPGVYCALPVDDAEEVNSCFQIFAEENDWDTLRFRDATLYTIPVEYGAYSLFGPLFEPITETCIAVTDGFIYIGTSVEQLKPILNNVLSGRTLGSSRFKQDLNNNISSSWNTFAYVNTSAALHYLQNRWLSDTSTIAACSTAQINQQTGIISLTCARQSDGIVISGTWIFDKPDSSDSFSWATALDADLAGRPIILKDTKTNEYWIAAADVFENIYLLNSDGVILWKKDVGAKANSDFQLLYAGQPEKRSIAFSTDKAIYIIDLEGELHKSFPVTINDGLASNLLVTDYENNQSYRLLFCDNEGVLNNYTTDGKQTEGWLKPETKLGREGRIFYNPLGDKDYLIAINPNNVAAVFDRKGKEVAHINGTNYNKGLPSFFSESDKKSWLTFSEDGALIRVTPDGGKKMIGEKSFGENFLFSVINSEIVVVVADGKLYTLDNEGNELKSVKLSDSGIDFLKVFGKGDKNYILFHTNEDVVGIQSVTSDYSQNSLKSGVQAFDCVLHKDKIVLITAQGKTIVSETLDITESEKEDD